MSERDRMELADLLDRADDKIQHGMGFGGYDPNGLPFWLADAILDSDWLAARDARIRADIVARIEDLPYNVVTEFDGSSHLSINRADVIAALSTAKADE